VRVPESVSFVWCLGEYACAHTLHRDLFDCAYREWRDCWRADAAAPALSLSPVDDGHYLLMDTRGLEDTEMGQFLDEEQARTVLMGGPFDRQPLAQWAIERKLAVALDDWCVPLAVADVEIRRRFEAPAAKAQLPVLSSV